MRGRDTVQMRRNAGAQPGHLVPGSTGSKTGRPATPKFKIRAPDAHLLADLGLVHPHADEHDLLPPVAVLAPQVPVGQDGVARGGLGRPVLVRDGGPPGAAQGVGESGQVETSQSALGGGKRRRCK